MGIDGATTHEELLENELASAGLVLLNGSQDPDTLGHNLRTAVVTAQDDNLVFSHCVCRECAQMCINCYALGGLNKLV